MPMEDIWDSEAGRAQSSDEIPFYNIANETVVIYVYIKYLEYYGLPAQTAKSIIGLG